MTTPDDKHARPPMGLAKEVFCRDQSVEDWLRRDIASSLADRPHEEAVLMTSVEVRGLLQRQRAMFELTRK